MKNAHVFQGGYIHYLDCGVSLMEKHIGRNLNCILEIHVILLYVNFTSIKL